MAKERTINELRQSKEYKIDPVQQVLAQQIEELEEHDKQGDSFIVQKEFKKDITEIEDWIADEIFEEIKDQLFETICKHMNEWDELQVSNYINYDNRDLPTEIMDAAYDWHHNVHANILGKVFKNFKENYQQGNI
jgi:predicted DNA-binding protein